MAFDYLREKYLIKCIRNRWSIHTRWSVCFKKWTQHISTSKVECRKAVYEERCQTNTENENMCTVYMQIIFLKKIKISCSVSLKAGHIQHSVYQTYLSNTTVTYEAYIATFPLIFIISQLFCCHPQMCPGMLTSRFWGQVKTKPFLTVRAVWHRPNYPEKWKSVILYICSSEG